jgi:hypothetical protein
VAQQNGLLNISQCPLAKVALRVIAWEDSQYSFDLVRTSFTDRCGLVIYSKRVNTDAEFCHDRSRESREARGAVERSRAPEKTTDDRELA